MLHVDLVMDKQEEELIESDFYAIRDRRAEFNLRTEKRAD